VSASERTLIQLIASYCRCEIFIGRMPLLSRSQQRGSVITPQKVLRQL